MQNQLEKRYPTLILNHGDFSIIILYFSVSSVLSVVNRKNKNWLETETLPKILPKTTH